jgi:hypothetical protein
MLLMKKAISLMLLTFTLFSCGGGGESESKETNLQDQSIIAKNYVSEILNLMQEHAITRYEVDWGNLEAEVNALAANAKNIKETYPAITKALELLNTNHSALFSASDEILAYYSGIKCEDPVVTKNPNINNIGYIKVDAFSLNDSPAINYATNIQNKIASQDSADLDGWIVDLRDNTGGNMYPMLAGIGPLLGDDDYGYFVDANESYSSWGYKDGSSYNNGENIVTVEDPYYLLNPLPKIAILSNRRVASSGEITLIAFKKVNNTRVFGADTCGLSTGNVAFTLSDGSYLILTTVITADREQVKYGGRVEVDQKESPSDVVNKAVEWLQSN